MNTTVTVEKNIYITNTQMDKVRGGDLSDVLILAANMSKNFDGKLDKIEGPYIDEKQDSLYVAYITKPTRVS
jgi:hypothetical protein